MSEFDRGGDGRRRQRDETPAGNRLPAPGRVALTDTYGERAASVRPQVPGKNALTDALPAINGEEPASRTISRKLETARRQLASLDAALNDHDEYQAIGKANVLGSTIRSLRAHLDSASDQDVEIVAVRDSFEMFLELAQPKLEAATPSKLPGRRAPREVEDRHAIMDRATIGAPGELPFRSEMERSFAADFSDVSAFLGQADALSDLDAVAAARGEQVAFASTAPSREVVAHELAHVVQHRRGGSGDGVEAFGGDDSAAEREADAAASAVSTGELASTAMTGSVRGGGAVHRAKDPPSPTPLPAPLLPAKLNLVLGGDLFEIEFSCTGPDDARMFGVDIRYAGEHPSTSLPASPSSTVKLRKKLDQRLAIKAKVLRSDDHQVIVDVFDNKFDLFRIEDVVGFDEKTRARSHSFTARMFGVAGQGSILVRDPKAKPHRSPADAASQGDVPGEYPATIDTGDAKQESWEIRFDADGDGSKESLLHTRLLERHPTGAAKKIAFGITQLASGARADAATPMELPSADWRFGWPSLGEEALQTDGGGTTQFVQIDGFPSAKNTTYLANGFLVQIGVPVRTATGVSYTLSNRRGWSQTVTLPADKKDTAPGKPNAADDVANVAGLWTTDLTLGPYQDRYRLVIEPRGIMKGILTLAPIERSETKLAMSTDVELPMAMRMAVLESNDVGIKLDFGYDNKPDLELYYRVAATINMAGDNPHPEENREALIRVRGSAIRTGEQFFRFQNARGTWISQSEKGTRTADAQSSMATDAVTGLAERKGLDTFDSQFDAYEALMKPERKNALAEKLITKAVYDATAELSDLMVTMRPQYKANPAKVDPDLKARATAATLKLHAALDAITPTTSSSTEIGDLGAGPSVIQTTTSNAYTGYSKTTTYLSYESSTAQDLVAAIKGNQWGPAFQSYNTLVGGVDRWIVDQMKSTKGAKDPDVQRREHLTKMRLAMGTIADKKPMPVHAVFHPAAQYKPWESNLSRVPLSLWYWQEGDDWHLMDMTNPDRRPHVTVGRKDHETTPGTSLFEKLNDKLIFPKGYIHYQVPEGIGGSVECEEKKKWYEWVQEIAMVVALVGMALATAGGAAAAVGGWMLAGSALASGVASGADLIDRANLGVLDGLTATLDILNIIFAFAAFGSHGAGVIRGAAMKAAAKGAPFTGFKGVASVAIGKSYLPLKGVSMGASGATVLVLAGSLPDQIRKISEGPGDDSEKHRAMALVITQFAVNFGLNFIAIKGDMAAFSKGRDLQITMRGDVPVASLVGEVDPHDIMFSRGAVEYADASGAGPKDRVDGAVVDGKVKTRIDVVEMDGQLITLDNKRLLDAQAAGHAKIDVVFHNPREPFPPDRAAGEFVLKRTVYLDKIGRPTLTETDRIWMDKGHVARTYGEAATIRSANQGEIKVGDATASFPLGGRRAQPRVLSPGERAPDGPEGNYDATRPTVDNIDVNNDLARNQTAKVNRSIVDGKSGVDFEAKSKDGKVTYGEMYKRWIEGPEPVDVSGRAPRAKYSGDPAYAAYFEEWKASFQGMVDAPGSTIALEAKARARAHSLDSLDLKSLDPANPNYYAMRAALVDKLGADAIARYEAASLGNKVGDVKTVISDGAIAELRNKFPDAEIYVTGKAARAHERSANAKDVTEVEVMLVVPDGTPGPKRAALEADAAAMAIPTSESFAKATGKDALPVRATARTRKDAVGMMTGERGPTFARIDANVPQLDAAHATELATLGAPRAAEITRRLGTPLVSSLMNNGLSAKQVDEIAHAFNQTQLGAFHAEGLAASSIHDLASLDASARRNLFGPKGITGTQAHELLVTLKQPLLESLAKVMPGADLHHLVQGLGGANVVRVAGVVSPTEMAHLGALPADQLAKLGALHGMNLRNVAALPASDLAALAKLDPAKLEQISHLPGAELAKMHPIDVAKVDAKLADVGAIEAHVDAGLKSIRPHLLESDPLARGGEIVDPTRTRLRMNVPGKGKPMRLDVQDIVVLEPMPGDMINGVEVTGRLAEPKGKPIATGSLVQTGGRWEVPNPSTPDTRITVETGSGRHPYAVAETPPPGTRVRVSPGDIAAQGFAGGHTRASWIQTETTYADLIAGKTETQVGFKLPGGGAEIRITKIDYKVRAAGKVKDVRYPKTVFENAAQLDQVAAHAKPYIAAAWEAKPLAPGAEDVLVVDVPIKTTAGADAVLKLEVPRAGRPTMAKPTDADMSTWWPNKDNFAKGGALNP